MNSLKFAIFTYLKGPYNTRMSSAPASESTNSPQRNHSGLLNPFIYIYIFITIYIWITQAFWRDQKTSVGQQGNYLLSLHIIASEESILFSHMGPPKCAIKSVILVVEQFFRKHFLIIFQYWIDSNHEPARPEPAQTSPTRSGQDARVTFSSRFLEVYFSVPEGDTSFLS